MTFTATRSRSLRNRPGAAAVTLAATAALLAGCSSSDDKSDPLAGDKPSGDTVVVGSNNFPESTLLADIYGEALKAKGIEVSYQPNIGSREVTYGQLRNGSVTVLPEYNGSLLAYLDPKAEQKSSDAVNAAVKTKLDAKLTLLESSPAENKDSVALNAETAKKYDLTSDSTLEDLKGIAPDLVIGGSPEFQTRQQGLKGLESEYGLEFKSFKALDAGGPLTRAALTKNTVQAADVFTTDPSITKEGFVVLKDPKNLFGFAQVTPLVYKSGLSQEGVDALNAVSAKLDTKTLLDLDTQVQLENKDPLDVAKAWLKSAGLG
ncbi:ABC transporter substrate-binding protein [Streptomyces caeruleatus]|uniref:Glycine/betaine ABC transporter substrate-binding protein n=1 Tax=Streptomyces caeruleatus TaxID=661399 RepID=A0A117RQE0_9ACTN|nr:ABC transporter substrate-binding protein [Streptomyces caeruleatus]KUO03484.1 glycine/betaine ABC transporter substrate-binding protein [Streptomyces caeruleatus]